MEEAINANNVEIAAVTAATGKFRLYTRAELEAIITSLS